jgi:hypothetical protein
MTPDAPNRGAADVRQAAEALRAAATARGDCASAWRLAELASLLDREADLADLDLEGR